MTYSMNYPWHAAYATAVLETDSSQMLARILKALEAIEERLRIRDVDDNERAAMEDARLGIAALKRERVTSVFRIDL